MKSCYKTKPTSKDYYGPSSHALMSFNYANHWYKLITHFSFVNREASS